MSSAPQIDGGCTQRVCFSDNQKREFMELLARAVAEDEESGALGFDTLLKIGKGICDVGKTIFGGGRYVLAHQSPFSS